LNSAAMWQTLSMLDYGGS